MKIKKITSFLLALVMFFSASLFKGEVFANDTDTSINSKEQINANESFSVERADTADISDENILESLDKDISLSTQEIETKKQSDKEKQENLERAANTETQKIELKIARLVDNVPVEMPTEWYTQQIIDSIVDLDISGNNYTVDNPYIILKLPKTDKIKDVKFVDSAAGTTERYEDDNYRYIKYKYTRLNGGTHYTYQFFFMFDGHFAKNGDSIEAETALYDGNGNELKKFTQKYTAKTVGFEIWSVHGNSGMSNVKNVAKSIENGDEYDGHDYVVRGATETIDDLKTSPSVSHATNVFAAVYPKKIEGVNESVGIEYPKNLKIVYTYPKEEGLRETPAHSVKGAKKLNWSQEDNVYTFIVEEPTFDFLQSDVKYWTNNRYGTGVNSRMEAKGVSVNKKLPIKIDFYKNVNEDGTGGEYIGTRIENFTFQPLPFTKGGSFTYNKRSFGDYHIGDEFAYIYSPEYYHLKDEILKGPFNMDEKGGIPLVTNIINGNTGSSREKPWEGGYTSQISEIYTKLMSGNSYFRSIEIRAVNTNNNKPKEIKDRHVEEIKSTINSGNTKLYGIDKDGKESLLKEHIHYGETINIDDKERKYEELVVRFENPVTLDNIILQLRERQWFNASELDKISKLEDGAYTYESFSAVTSLDKKTNEFKKGKYEGSNASLPAYFTVEALHPTVNEYISAPQVVEYKPDSTFDFKVGPNFPRHIHDQTIPYGDLNEINNVKTITLLPVGFEYAGEASKDMYDANWKSNPIEPKISTVENFQGSGKTAVIVDYGTVGVAKKYPLNLKIRATKYATRGENDFVNYMTYDENDFIKPYNGSNDKVNYYVDALDLDKDGDTSEIFMKKHTTVTFVPPLELMLNNTVKYEGEYHTSATGDLGHKLSYNIKIFNNSIKDVESLNIIDVFPKAGDHSISPNEKGEYPGRNSTYETPLTNSLEEANPELLSKLDFFYQVSDQGADLQSVRDGKWLTKDQVDDFSKVKSIKVVLKDGQVLKSKEEFNIMIPIKIPGIKTLDEKTSVAFNSSAFSTDNRNYIEGNLTKVDFIKYAVKGIAYLDINKNGQYDAGDILEKNVDVRVLNSDGTQAVDFDGKEIKAKTDNKGEYSLFVYKRGDYLVQFGKNESHIFATNTSGTEEVANSILSDRIVENNADTSNFKLNPVHKEQIMNVALYPVYGNIKLLKISADETGEDNNPKKIEGVEFALKTKNGKSVYNYKGEEITNLKTDEEGIAKFDLVPYGEYIIKEVSAPKQYVVSDDSHQAKITENSEAVSLTIENSIKKGSITVKKVDNTTKARPLEGVEFSLTGNGKVLEGITDKEGKVYFENLEYGDYILKETKTVDGYELNKDQLKVEVRDNGKIYEIEVVNNLINPKISVSGEKIWEDEENQDGIRPENITVHLYANDNFTGKSFELNDDNNWRYSFKDLPTYDEKGDKISYRVEEDAVEDYTTEISEAKFDTAGNITYDITNIHKPKLRDIKVSKTWVDEDNKKKLRPEEIKVNLIADGDLENPVGTAIVKADEDGKWEATFNNIVFNKKGKEIQYTVIEDTVENYKEVVTGTMENGFTITNTLDGKKSIGITKKWVGKAKDSIEVILMQDGKEYKEAKITSSDNWQYTFADIEVYDIKDGHEYQYEVKEIVIDGYKSKIEKIADNSYQITNEEILKPKVVNTGDSTNIGGYVMLTLVSLIGLIILKRRTRTEIS